jgi:hypothetical protein
MTRAPTSSFNPESQPIPRQPSRPR